LKKGFCIIIFINIKVIGSKKTVVENTNSNLLKGQVKEQFFQKKGEHLQFRKYSPLLKSINAGLIAI
jgi:hypothetical protein